MPKFNYILQNFLGGEVSPKWYGRTDTDQYRASLKKLKNMWVYPQGGGSRRTGTIYKANQVPTTKEDETDYFEDLVDSARIIPFVASRDEVYYIIFNGVSYQGSGNEGPLIHIYNPKEDYLFSVGMTSFTFDRIRDSGTAYPSLNDLDDADLLANLQFTQKGDVMFLFHPSIPPLQIVRYGTNRFYYAHWYLKPEPPTPTGVVVGRGATSIYLEIAKAWPYVPIGNSDTTITASATTGTSITLTASASFFTEDMVGTPMAVQNGGTIGYVVITAYTSATVVTARVIQTLPGTAAYTTWFEAAWSQRRGYPATGIFWQGSLLMGDTAANPGQVWRSQIGDIYEFTNDTLIDPAGDPTDADPCTYVIAAEENNFIQWMVAQRGRFLVGTQGREYAVNAFTNTEIEIEEQTSSGSEYKQPVVVSGVPLHVQVGGQRVREMVYQERLNGYVSQDTTYFAEHITRESQNQVDDPNVPKIKGMTYQKTPNDIIWAWDNNGYLYACTRKLEGEITAWHRHELGGLFGSNTFAHVVSAASAPNPNGGGYDLYLLVKRTIDGSTKVFLEKMAPDFTWSSLHPDSNVKDREPVYMDAAKIFRTVNEVYFRAKLIADTSAKLGAGTTTATTTGTINYSEGFANFATAKNSYITYAGAGLLLNQQIGTVKWDWYPSANTNAECMISICKAAADTDNMIEVDWDEGEIFVQIKDDAGADIVARTSLGFVPWRGNYTAKLRFELTYNITSGQTKLYVNGKQLGSTLSGTGTRGDIGFIRLGANVSAGDISGGGIGNVEIYDYIDITGDHEVYEYQEAAAEIEGLDYLEGEEVTVLANGKYLGEYTVTGGAITLDDAYDTVIVGLPFTHVMTTQSLEAGSGVGSAQGRPTRIDYLALRLYQTGQCKFGRDESNQEEIDFTDPDADMADPDQLFNGDKVLPFEGGYDEDSGITITGSKPLPCNITCLVGRGMTND